jgi:polyisoprenoid-binding protein YceI
MDFQLEKTLSGVIWTGFQPNKSHYGTVKFKQGKVRVADGKILSGYAQVDLSSLTVTDTKLSEDKKAELETHLKSNEFFDVSGHPSALFEINEVKASNGHTTHIVSGDMTIRGFKHHMDIPVNVMVSNEKLDVKAKFNITRTHFGVNFMIEESFGDSKVLADFEVEVHIVAENSNNK